MFFLGVDIMQSLKFNHLARFSDTMLQDSYACSIACTRRVHHQELYGFAIWGTAPNWEPPLQDLHV